MNPSERALVMRVSGLVMMGMMVVVVVPVMAQETTAGQANDAQVTWSALSAKIDQVSTQNKILADMLDKYNICSAKKMIYMQSAVGPDNTDGCVSAAGGTCTVTSKAMTGTSCPAGSMAVVTSATPTGTGNGTHNSPYMSSGGVATTKACLTVACE